MFTIASSALFHRNQAGASIPDGQPCQGTDDQTCQGIDGQPSERTIPEAARVSKQERSLSLKIHRMKLKEDLIQGFIENQVCIIVLAGCYIYHIYGT